MPKQSDTNPNYWDCECDEDYIHSKAKGNHCKKCGAYEDEMPDSIEHEIKYQYDPLKDKAIKKEHSA